MNKAYRHIRLTIWICALVLLLDRVTKALSGLLEKPVVLIPGVLGLNYTENTGIAFSLFPGASPVIGALTVLCLTVGLFLLCRLSLKPATWVCVMLVTGGALGNALDRIWAGHVPDMIEILAFRWAIFNVADIAVVVGIILLMIRILRHPEEWKEDHGQSDDNG